MTLLNSYHVWSLDHFEVGRASHVGSVWCGWCLDWPCQLQSSAKPKGSSLGLSPWPGQGAMEPPESQSNTCPAPAPGTTPRLRCANELENLRSAELQTALCRQHSPNTSPNEEASLILGGLPLPLQLEDHLHHLLGYPMSAFL